VCVHTGRLEWYCGSYVAQLTVDIIALCVCIQVVWNGTVGAMLPSLQLILSHCACVGSYVAQLTVDIIALCVCVCIQVVWSGTVGAMLPS